MPACIAGMGFVMLPKVAVIILNHNGQRYLGGLLDEAIESALKQTYFNVEVV